MRSARMPLRRLMIYCQLRAGRMGVVYAGPAGGGLYSIFIFTDAAVGVVDGYAGPLAG